MLIQAVSICLICISLCADVNDAPENRGKKRPVDNSLNSLTESTPADSAVHKFRLEPSMRPALEYMLENCVSVNPSTSVDLNTPDRSDWVYCALYAGSDNNPGVEYAEERLALIKHLMEHYQADPLAHWTAEGNPAVAIDNRWHTDAVAIPLYTLLFKGGDYLHRLTERGAMKEFVAHLAGSRNTQAIELMVSSYCDYPFHELYFDDEFVATDAQLTVLFTRCLPNETFEAITQIPTKNRCDDGPDGPIADELARRGLSYVDRRTECNQKQLEFGRAVSADKVDVEGLCMPAYFIVQGPRNSTLYKALMHLFPLLDGKSSGCVLTGAMVGDNKEILAMFPQEQPLKSETAFAAAVIAALMGKYEPLLHLLNRDPQGTMAKMELNEGGTTLVFKQLLLQSLIIGISRSGITIGNFMEWFEGLSHMQNSWGRFFYVVMHMTFHLFASDQDTIPRLNDISDAAAQAVDVPSIKECAPIIFRLQARFDQIIGEPKSIILFLNSLLFRSSQEDICYYAAEAAKAGHRQFFRDMLNFKGSIHHDKFMYYCEHCHNAAIDNAVDDDLATFLRDEITPLL